MFPFSHNTTRHIVVVVIVVVSVQTGIGKGGEGNGPGSIICIIEHSIPLTMACDNCVFGEDGI